jgi:hypothetical protein
MNHFGRRIEDPTPYRVGTRLNDYGSEIKAKLDFLNK